MAHADSPQVAAIRARYKNSLTQKAALIAGHLNAVKTLSEVDPDSALTQQIHGDLHKLAGSSGMYGYDDIAQCARLAMQNMTEQALTNLQQSLTQLHGLLEQHA